MQWLDLRLEDQNKDIFEWEVYVWLTRRVDYAWLYGGIRGIHGGPVVTNHAGNVLLLFLEMVCL